MPVSRKSKKNLSKKRKNVKHSNKTRKIQKMKGGDDGKIGFTFDINIIRIHEQIAVTSREGYSIENFLKGILLDSNGRYSKEIFVYKYDHGDYYLSNGQTATGNNIGLLRSCGIITKIYPNLLNKSYAPYLVDMSTSLNLLPDNDRIKIEGYRQHIRHFNPEPVPEPEPELEFQEPQDNESAYGSGDNI